MPLPYVLAEQIGEGGYVAALHAHEFIFLHSVSTDSGSSTTC